jgi:hypothetical protein
MEAQVAIRNGNRAVTAPTAKTIESVLIQGNLKELSSELKTQYYQEVCKSLGLNPLTQPFAYITLNGKEVLYAKRDCTEQLRKIHNVSLTITNREKIDDLYIVTARASLPSGRVDEKIGAVSVAGLKGENLANALMKAETKASRRVTLSIVGLGLLDETEVETIAVIDPKMAVMEALADMPEPERPPLVTTIESLENPWKHSMEMGKYKGCRVYVLPPSVMEQAERAFRQNRITETDYVNIRDALLNPELKPWAIEEDTLDQSDYESLQETRKGKSDEQ